MPLEHNFLRERDNLMKMREREREHIHVDKVFSIIMSFWDLLP